MERIVVVVILVAKSGFTERQVCSDPCVIKNPSAKAEGFFRFLFKRRNNIASIAASFPALFNS